MLIGYIQYVGQTTQEMRKRHYEHRHIVMSGTAGLGSHFHEVHGWGLDLKKEDDLKTCMSSFRLTIVASVKPTFPPEEVQTHLDNTASDAWKKMVG